MTHATAFSATLPDWLLDRAMPERLATDDDRMRFVHDLADTNWRAGNGGPFAAIVVDSQSGELISVGVNVVLSSGLSSTHAEVVALSLAQATLGGWDLGAERALELVVNWRPCAMCYGATIWSGVKRLAIAGFGPECEDLTGFDEGPVRDDWREQLESRGIAVTTDVLRDGALRTFAEYGASGATVYNATRDRDSTAN
ncbi:MAG: nucleoside deaminase [Pseudolysinimonas sp.]